MKRENRQLRDAAAQANYTQAALTTAMDSPILNDNSAEREEILQDALNEQILNETLAEFSLLSKTA
ncbi:MAG: hypothetical protein HWD59_03700 [Coxiellaceae bacterium]|nr:MAG: hypothetical protein HWD59_03700 [Coxiellaceae bacterium]